MALKGKEKRINVWAYDGDTSVHMDIHLNARNLVPSEFHLLVGSFKRAIARALSEVKYTSFNMFDNIHISGRRVAT